jgi:hypothetical protein
MEGVAEVVGQLLGGGDGVRVGLDLDGAVVAGCLDEFADLPAGLVVDPATAGQRREDDGQMGVDSVALACSALTCAGADTVTNPYGHVSSWFRYHWS